MRDRTSPRPLGGRGMRVDFYGLAFETSRVTFYLWSPWRASALEHKLFDALRGLPRLQPEEGPDALREMNSFLDRWAGSERAPEIRWLRASLLAARGECARHGIERFRNRTPDQLPAAGAACELRGCRRDRRASQGCSTHLIGGAPAAGAVVRTADAGSARLRTASGGTRGLRGCAAQAGRGTGCRWRGIAQLQR